MRKGCLQKPVDQRYIKIIQALPSQMLEFEYRRNEDKGCSSGEESTTSWSFSSLLPSSDQ
jgi:hypothetical protein